ncbi:hypothetical protein JAAARDRAFT_656647 [Jaapia argillacea MUCL 33604]|uniref:Uncharacterized protein n=1 Tax=Jaapia argillacea MUCL 33604 TaxID=933084 RepID=A0A067PZC7_9AGAM|nr:hypothetical protein JAAARDRAFT_656647 [Jaapia argillacea MUCL 33604]
MGKYLRMHIQRGSTSQCFQNPAIYLAFACYRTDSGWCRVGVDSYVPQLLLIPQVRKLNLEGILLTECHE